jgi:Ni,Fe-hydrogenase III small subunit
VDILVPGCPPPPLAILNALLALTGRAQPRIPAPAAPPRGGARHV